MASPEIEDVQQQHQPRKPSTGRIVGLTALCVVVVGGGMYLFAHVIRTARESARQSSCKCNFKQIGLALHNYHDVHGCFPPAYVSASTGKKLHSWRVLILPYLEASPLYSEYRFDEPWDGPNNRKLASRMPEVYRCPSATAGATETHYVAVVGPNTAFPGNRVRRFDDIKDGVSNTIIVVEKVGRPVHWMSPDDVTPEEFLNAANLDGHHHPAGTMGLFADGSVKFLTRDFSRNLLEKLFTIDGGETVEWPE